MTSKEISKRLNLLGVETYNECKEYVVGKGINGHATLFKAGQTPEKTYILIAAHLKQMGRDSLKMELNDLLSITKHE